MNYFELYNIPISFLIDKKYLSNKLVELQRKFHPDLYSNADMAKQQEVLEISSMINKAYKTFQSIDSTIKYVLELKGMIYEGEKYQLPQSFLLEVMELNEMKMDNAEPDIILRAAQTLQEEIYLPVKTVIENLKGNDITENHLLQLKEYYYKKKYLDRLMAEKSI